MRDQKLFEALQDICDFTALETDMDEIKRAIFTDKESDFRILLETIKSMSDEAIIHATINEWLDDYEYPNDFKP